MTRRLLTLISLAVAVVLSVSLVTAPVNGEAPVTTRPGVHPAAEAGDRLQVQVGDGLVRLRFESGPSRMSVTIEIEVPRFLRRGDTRNPQFSLRAFQN